MYTTEEEELKWKEQCRAAAWDAAWDAARAAAAAWDAAWDDAWDAARAADARDAAWSAAWDAADARDEKFARDWIYHLRTELKFIYRMEETPLIVRRIVEQALNFKPQRPNEIKS